MTKKVLFIFALLCAVVQGAWAQTFDVWDGHTLEAPSLTIGNNAMVITKASQLAYVRANWEEKFPETPYPDIKNLQIFLDADIDMGETSWVPLPTFTQVFFGQNHTIRINISGATDNYQGLFKEVGEGARVYNLHVIGKISCTSSRLVGGIAGENYGKIEGCWVSADVSTDWTNSLSALGSKVGGITGENHGTIQYCCMSGNVTNNDAEVGGLVGYNNGGTIDNCTFYGTRYSTHDQDNVYVGKQSGTLTNVYEGFTDEELTDYLKNDFTDQAIYSEAIQRPFSVTTSSEGYGTVAASPTATRAGQTVTVTVSDYTTLNSVTVKDADGTDVTLSGNATDGYTFTMPKRNVTVTAIFGTPNWIDADKRAAAFSNVNGNTVTIMNAAEMGLLSYLSNTAEGAYGQGMTFLLDENIDMSAYQWTPISRWEDHPFWGTFDGQGHALSGINVSAGTESYAGLLGYLGAGIVQNLKLVNSSITQTLTDFLIEAGAIAGFVKQGCILNCYVGSDVKVTGYSCGGIAGYMEGLNSRIEGCYSAATVSGKYCVGGIVGRTESSVTNTHDTGKILRNVSQATIQPTGDNPKSYAYILGGTTSTHSKVASNYYIIDRTPINGYDTRAYHATLDAALKDYGYDIAYKDSEYEYSCSGLEFKSGDQFLMNGEWYVAENENFYFNPTNDLDGAVLGNVTAGSATVEKSDGYYHFTTAEDVEVSGTMELMLSNDGNYSSLFDRFNGHTMNVTLADRTLYRDGSWDTFYLPFALSAEQLDADDCPLKGATVKSLQESSFANHTLTLKFSDDRNNIVDGFPYIVKWTNTGDPIENTVFKHVTTKNAPGKANTVFADFKGTFSSITFTANDKSILYMGANNKLCYPVTDVPLGAFRAYFQLKGITVGDQETSETSVKNIVLDFGDGGIATGIVNAEANSSLFLPSSVSEWYDLQGRKLNGKPTQNGLYINNGKKIFIK